MSFNLERRFFMKGLAIANVDVAKNEVYWRFRGEQYSTSIPAFWTIQKCDADERCKVADIEDVRRIGKLI